MVIKSKGQPSNKRIKASSEGSILPKKKSKTNCKNQLNQQKTTQVKQREILQEQPAQQQFYYSSPLSRRYLNLQQISSLDENELLEQGIYLLLIVIYNIKL